VVLIDIAGGVAGQQRSSRSGMASTSLADSSGTTGIRHELWPGLRRQIAADLEWYHRIQQAARV
jgi:hypothetical protein